MIANRHLNGRGQILDYGDANKTAHISRNSVVKGNAIVRDARLVNESCADEHCKIFGGTLDNAYVAGSTIVAGDVFIGERSVARCKAISGHARVTRSQLEGIVEVFDDAIVDQVRLSDGVMVYGNAKLWGPWELGGFARIHEGLWWRAPITVELDHTCVTECVNGRIIIECRCRTREYWLKHGPAFGRRAGWTEAQVEAAFNVIKEWPFSNAAPSSGA